MAAPAMVHSEMIAEDVNTVSVLAPPAEELQDSVYTQLAQQMIAAQEAGQEVTVDLLAKYMQIEAHDWHNRTRRAILGLISLAGTVGAGVSMLISLFWPATKVDIWEAINGNQYVRNIIRQEIFEFELHQHRSEIQALETTVSRYNTAGGPIERGNFLSLWITQADRLSILLRNSTNNIHLLLHIVTVAVLHVAALHERLTFGKELYGQDNTANWKQDLVDVFEMYTSNALPNIFNKWKEWRATEIEITAWRVRAQHGNLIYRPSSSHATVEDKISGEKIRFQVTSEYSTTIFSEVCQDHKTRMMNEAIADMASCLSPTFAFHKLLPDDIQTQFSPYDEVAFGRVFRGPYSQDLLQSAFTRFKAFRSRATRFDQTTRDRILQVIIRAGNLVDAIQFWYDNWNPNAMTAGIMAGHPTGGTRHQVDVRDRPIQELRMGFASDVLTWLQLHFEDGTSTQQFGSSGWASNIVTCTAPYGYRLSSWAFREDPGPFSTPAISVLRFQFTPDDIRD
nr:insecticidal protein IPD113 [Amauropelta noveboracensis]